MESRIHTFLVKTKLPLFHVNCTHIKQISYVHKTRTLNSISLGHRSSNKINFSETIFINLSAAPSMCGKHNDHIHSTERKHSRREKERQRRRASADAISEDCLSRKIYIHNTHCILNIF